MVRRAPLLIADESIPAGRSKKLEIPIARLMSGTPVALPVVAFHGISDGPAVWLSAAIHGDEIEGVEIIRRVMGTLDPKTMAGTVLAVPVANVHGFNSDDRYLPDRRDLNRSFPGSTRGSLASRVAHLLMTEVVGRCEVGIDLHTGSDQRINLPQIRADLDDARTLELARVFDAPIAIHAKVRDGSLRQAATDAGASVLLYEGGEASRFDQASVEAGTTGVLRILSHLEMVVVPMKDGRGTLLSRTSRWMRASRSGILHLDVALGETVDEGQSIATIVDPFGKRLGQVRSTSAGIVIGHTQHPLVNRGDAVAHIAFIG